MRKSAYRGSTWNKTIEDLHRDDRSASLGVHHADVTRYLLMTQSGPISDLGQMPCRWPQHQSGLIVVVAFSRDRTPLDT